MVSPTQLLSPIKINLTDVREWEDPPAIVQRSSPISTKIGAYHCKGCSLIDRDKNDQ